MLLRKLAVTSALVTILGIAAYLAPHEANATLVATTFAAIQ
ncbi:MULTISPECIES: hypothetical protein [Azorhizobium]|nr:MULTISPECIES: hypothetical protein [Azorhizobium]TDU00646.1 hypothetical protein DFO45_0147 [Azorhizobium sp. AG788]